MFFIRIYDIENANWGYLLFSGLSVATTYRATAHRNQMFVEVCSVESTLKNSCWGYWGSADGVLLGGYQNRAGFWLPMYVVLLYSLIILEYNLGLLGSRKFVTKASRDELFFLALHRYVNENRISIPNLELFDYGSCVIVGKISRPIQSDTQSRTGLSSRAQKKLYRR